MAKRSDKSGPFMTSLAHHAADPFRLLIESVVDYAIVMLDPAGNVASWNPGAQRIYGYTPEAIVGQHVSRFSTLDDAASGLPAELMQRALSEGHLEHECQRVRQDGSEFTATITLSDLKDYFGNHAGFAEVTRDISEYRRAQDAVRAERDISNAMLNSLPGVYYMYDENGHFMRWNHRFELVTEYSADEIRQLHPLDLFDGPDKQLLAERIANVFRDGFDEVEANFLTKSGKRIPYYFNGIREVIEGKPCLLGMGIDMSNYKHTEQALRESALRLQQAQKMEAVGLLAGGVAHDFNNLLTVINGYSDLLMAQAPEGSSLRDGLYQIYRAGERARTLTRQLLTFGRKQILEPRVLNLNEVAGEVEKMLRRVIGENIVLSLSLANDIGAVWADPGQIELILLNLAVNARDAMPTGGSLVIETSNTVLDATYCDPIPDLKPGDYVLLAVSDNGCGIADDIKQRIFEPFFTTKPTGKGTGLGLATVHGIVKQSQGHVAVYSESGLGTTFKIYLPVVADASQPQQETIAETLPEGTETVLLVEDEEAVRMLAKQVLEGCGYQVLVAENGNQACALAAAWQGPLHIAVSDVVMPLLGGRELAEQLATLRPECKVLFLSGYADEAVLRHGVLQANYAFLQKPFTPSVLAQKVRAVLDQ